MYVVADVCARAANVCVGCLTFCGPGQPGTQHHQEKFVKEAPRHSAQCWRAATFSSRAGSCTRAARF
eukprot:15395297-Alexandrium_andersonii.AAC.1